MSTGESHPWKLMHADSESRQKQKNTKTGLVSCLKPFSPGTLSAILD